MKLTRRQAEALRFMERYDAAAVFSYMTGEWGRYVMAEHHSLKVNARILNRLKHQKRLRQVHRNQSYVWYSYSVRGKQALEEYDG